MAIFNNQKEENKLIVINFVRLFFAGLIIFELLNFFKILQFSLEYTWLGLVITSVGSLLMVEVIAYYYRRKKGHRLHWSVWFLVAASLSLDAAGDFFHLYGKYNWWDQFAHLFVSAVVCFTLFTIISAFWIDQFKFSLLFKTGRLKLALFMSATSAITLSALYEIEEYTEDLLFYTYRSGLGHDTADDLLFNLFGVLAIVIFIIAYYLVTHEREVIE